MILKVRGVPEQGWVFYDDIAKVRVFTLEWKKKDDEPAIHFEAELGKGASQHITPDYVWVDFMPVGVQNPTPVDQDLLEGKRGWCQNAACRLRNGEELNIAFSEAYLLNDEGKTIERL